MDEIFDATLGQRRLTMFLLALFSGVALALALVGIYGVIAYYVAQRTQEVGIRRALGAQQSDILKLVLKQGLILTTIGGVIGIVAALALTRLMTTFLFGIKPTDPLTFASISILFLVVAQLATLIPAWRATRIDPMSALRL
jgi:ABC-type antimicrobial peptide transport system permease subunit